MYVAILGFQGIIDDVSVHTTEAGAMAKVEGHLEQSGYSAQRWFELLVETNEYPHEDYEPTNIYVCELEAQPESTPFRTC